MNAKDIYERIKQLDIPRRAKKELYFWWTQMKHLVEGIIRFIARHRHFGEAVLLGAALAWLLAHVPYIGGFLALCALVTAAAIGVMRELREDLDQLFADVPANA
jgi:hypothetical protein